MERTHIGEGEICEDEGLAEKTTTPTPHLPVLIRVMGWVVKSRMKGVRWSLEKKGWVERKCFNLCFSLFIYFNCQ